MHYKKQFVHFLLESGALTFGDFTLKSGRKSPYMINTGKFETGNTLSRLGCFYARAIYDKMELGVIPWETTMLYGAAYKGIPLATTTAIALDAAFDIDMGWAFNRKEEKDHGEGGFFVGRKPGAGDQVLIIDDVMTAGTALRHSFELFAGHAHEAKIIGTVIAVNRKERGRDERLTAVAEAQFELGVPIFSIIDIDEILAVLRDEEFEREYESQEKAPPPTEEQIAAIEDYLNEYRVGN